MEIVFEEPDYDTQGVRAPYYGDYFESEVKYELVHLYWDDQLFSIDDHNVLPVVSTFQRIFGFSTEDMTVLPLLAPGELLLRLTNHRDGPFIKEL